jgi:hypothetical protein
LKNLRLRGVQMHIGSQLTTVSPFEQAVRKVLPLVKKLKEKYGWNFSASAADWASFISPRSRAARRMVEIGGGEKYFDAGEIRRAPAAAAPAARPENPARAGPVHFRQRGHSRHARRICETHGQKEFRHRGRRDERFDPPGVLRFVSRNRSAHAQRRRATRPMSSAAICESGDYFCKDRPLPKVGEGDYLALLSAGAYGFVMASNYNARPLAAEVLVNGKKRRRRARTPAGERNLVGRKSCGMVEINCELTLNQNIPSRRTGRAVLTKPACAVGGKIARATAAPQVSLGLVFMSPKFFPHAQAGAGNSARPRAHPAAGGLFQQQPDRRPQEIENAAAGARAYSLPGAELKGVSFHAGRSRRRTAPRIGRWKPASNRGARTAGSRSLTRFISTRKAGSVVERSLCAAAGFWRAGQRDFFRTRPRRFI